MARKSATTISANGGINKITSRKENRKSAKKFKKLRNIAYSQHKSVESVIEEKMGPQKKKKRKTKAERRAAAKEREKLEEETAKFKPARQEEPDEGEEKYEDVLKEMEQVRRIREKQMVDAEDAEALRLGKQLGFDKRRGKGGKATDTLPRIFADDGLDYLLDMCDESKRRKLAEYDMSMGADDNSDDQSASEIDAESVASADDIDLSEGDDFGLGEDDGSDVEMGEGDDEEEDMNEEDMGDEEDGDSEELDEEEEKAPKTKEDIYGRTVDAKTGRLIEMNQAGARQKLKELEEKSEATEETKRMVDRSITGLINRLSEATVVKSKKTLHELMEANSTNEVRSSLTRCLVRVLRSPFRLQDSMLTTYALFIGLTHATVSSEITAHLVEEVCKAYVEAMEHPAEDKALENQTIFIAHLLNFRVVKAQLVVDLLKRLMDGEITPTKLSLFLNMAGYSIKALRRHASTPFSQMLNELSSKLADPVYEKQVRISFLGEELAQLRRGQPPAGVNADAAEHHISMLHGLTKKLSSVEKELGMSLQDLLDADTRGRWWVVGSAFQLPEEERHVQASSSSSKHQLSFAPDVLALAKRAQMNTQVRRNVFCSVVSASDEDDAFERLLRLALSGPQEREIIHILMTMLCREKAFNEFYPALIRRFCDYHKRFVMTTQFALWDRVRDAPEATPSARSHLAGLMFHLFRHRTLPLTALKVVEFGTLTKAMTGILKKLFKQLGELPIVKLSSVFECILDARKCRELTEGVRLFLSLNYPEHPAYQQIENMFATYR